MDPVSAATVPEGFRFETRYVVLSYLGLPSQPASTHTSSIGATGGDASEGEDKERSRRIKSEVEAELKLLDEDLAASSSTGGFDRLASPVFSPAHGDSSIEDSLAVLGDRLGQELDPYLANATHKLITGQVDYEGFRRATQEVCSHAQEGWNQVLVPLVLLQRLQMEGQPVGPLLSLGTRYLEDVQSNFIIQQGGWGAVFSLEDAEDPGVIIAEDSNDIYILSGEQLPPDHLSPPASLLTAADSSGPASWQTESLGASLVSGHESWAQVGIMDREDAKSLDSNEGVVALAEERSENNSSNSDIVHVEREEAELLAEGEGLQESMMSVLGTESELAELRAEFKEKDADEAAGADAGAAEAVGGGGDGGVAGGATGMDLPPSHTALIPEPPQPLVMLEEPVILEAPASLSAEPPLESVPESKPEPPALASVPDVVEAPIEVPVAAAPTLESSPPVPEPATQSVVEVTPEPKVEAVPEPVVEAVQEPLVNAVPEPVIESVSEPFVEVEPELVPELVTEEKPEPVVEASSDPVVAAAPEPAVDVVPELVVVPEPTPVVEAQVAPVGEDVVEERVPEPEPKPESTDLPVLLYGGAALVVVAALAAYGALSFRKK